MNFTPRYKFKLTGINLAISKGRLKRFEPKGPTFMEQQIFQLCRTAAVEPQPDGVIHRAG
jgi:hypothetical protein